MLHKTAIQVRFSHTNKNLGGATDLIYSVSMTASNPIGRPLKFESVEELETQINLYFDDCDKEEDTLVWALDDFEPDDDGKKLCTNCWKVERSKGCLLVSGRLKIPRPYTVTGLALWLDTTRHTLLHYEDRPDFLHTIVRAKLRIENFASERLFDPNTLTRGAIFSLSNNSNDWVEKKATELTIPKYSAKELASRIFDDDDDVAETASDESGEDQPSAEADTEKADLGSHETQAVSEDQ
jgi:hypothetical protein